MSNAMLFIFITGFLCLIVFSIVIMVKNEEAERYVNSQALQILGLEDWKYQGVDKILYFKSANAVYDYTPTKYFKDNREMLDEVDTVLLNKGKYAKLLENFLKNNEIMGLPQYSSLEEKLKRDLADLKSYNVGLRYTSPKGNSTAYKVMHIDRNTVEYIKSNLSLIMSKTEYNKIYDIINYK